MFEELYLLVLIGNRVVAMLCAFFIGQRCDALERHRIELIEERGKVGATQHELVSAAVNGAYHVAVCINVERKGGLVVGLSEAKTNEGGLSVGGARATTQPNEANEPCCDSIAHNV